MADRLEPEEILHNRYKILSLIGRGGMAEVYEALDLKYGERVAIKAIRSKLVGSMKAIARFRREIDISRRISHPNVLSIYDVVEVTPPDVKGFDVLRSAPFMVMELLQGETLADRLDRGELVTPEEARGIVVQIAQALSAAHEADVVHRDLKPDNIFLVPLTSGDYRVVLMDFGIAWTNRKDLNDPFSTGDVILGTPVYMAPEQLELEEALPASDIYALGLVIYEMLTGEFPFVSENPYEVVLMRMREAPIPPRRHQPELDDTWVELIAKCLARDSQDRIANLDEIMEMLGHRECTDKVPSKKPWRTLGKSWWPF